MIQQFLILLNDMGVMGLFIAMFLEGTSLPFPGVVIVLSYGYLLPFGFISTAFIAAGMSIMYSCASLIPYFLGKKIEGKLNAKMKKGINNGQIVFSRYGIWTVAFTRPFGIGNYISYVAGLSNVPIVIYLILTFLGIYPWSYIMLVLGHYFQGNYETIKNFYHSYSLYLYGTITIFTISTIMYFYRKSKKRAKGVERRDNR